VAPSLAGPLTLDGGGGADTLTVNDQYSTADDTYSISTRAIKRTRAAKISYSGVPTVTLNGGSGDETFRIRKLPIASVALQGGDGANTLDYSAFTGDITVDLPLGYATGLSGGISKIANVTGSQGNDLIVGDANANVLLGGTGRNVLIGGGGANTLDASGAQGDNILIGGTTDFDTDLTALGAVFAEWTRPDLSFTDRVSDLGTGTNSAGATPLNQVGDRLVLLTTATVHANNSPDTLTGTKMIDPATGKRAHNWFLYDTADTLVHDSISKDRTTQLD
jgi:Ca2+-binding RTX toxin-like protein